MSSSNYFPINIIFKLFRITRNFAVGALAVKLNNVILEIKV